MSGSAPVAEERQSDPSLSGGDARNCILNSTIANNSVDGIPGYGIYGGGTDSQLYGYEAFIPDSIVTFNPFLGLFPYSRTGSNYEPTASRRRTPISTTIPPTSSAMELGSGTTA